MKIALCFSGEPRFVKECYQDIRSNILDINNNVDIFVHTWFSEDISGQKLYTESISSFSGNSKISRDAISQINELYKPKKIIVESPKKFINTGLDWGESISKYYGNGDPGMSIQNFRDIKINNMYSFFYSNMKSILLKKEHELENDFKYDCVVRFRFDNIIKSPLYFSEYEMSSLHYQEMGQPDMMISDWINFSGSSNMDAFSSIFNNFEILSKISLSNYGAYSPESLIRSICDLFLIKAQGHNFGIRLPRHGNI